MARSGIPTARDGWLPSGNHFASASPPPASRSSRAASAGSTGRTSAAALFGWWEQHKDERAKMHKQRPDLGERLDKISAGVKRKGETFNGTAGAGHVSPDDAVRAG